MRLGVYAIYDRVALSYTGGLMTFPHDAVAVRTFGDVARDPQGAIGAHIEDYQLHRVAWWDQADGMTEILSPGFVVVTGSAWKASQVELRDEGGVLDLSARKAG